MKKIFFFILFFFILNKVSANTFTEILCPTTQDTRIWRDYDNTCGNSSAAKAQGYYVDTRIGLNRLNHILIKFNIDNISDKTVVNKARLRLYAIDQGEYKENIFYASRVTEDWADTTATWCYRTANNSWQSSGGAYTTENQAQVSIPSKYGTDWHNATGVYEEWIEWDITEILKAWITNVQPNYGIIIRQLDISNSSENQGIAFYSSEYADTTLRPQLIIDTLKKINIPPIINLYPEYETIKIFDTLNFTFDTSDSDGYISKMKMNYGDGQYDSTPPFSHKYNSVGNFTARLTVWDNDFDSSWDESFVNVSIPFDFDKDNLPDAWEMKNNLSANDASGNNGWYGDPDGDGIINGDEWRYGFNPWNNNSPSMPTAPSFNNIWTLNMQHEVISNKPTLSVNNSVYDTTNAFYDNIKYAFNLCRDSTLTQIYDSARGIPEGVNATSWPVERTLSENTKYWFISWSYVDNIKSNAMNAISFFVNAINSAPTKPTLSYPPDGSGVSTLLVGLQINNSYDEDNDLKTYEFRVYNDLGFLYETANISEGNVGITTYNTPVLIDNKWYGWKARAVDEYGKSGEWMDSSLFFINTKNDDPDVPVIKSPDDNSEITSQTPTLEISHSQDIDGNKIYYYFEIDTTVNFNSGNLQKSPKLDVISWQPQTLQDNTYWYWRSRSFDGFAYSPAWAIAGFFVNITNDAPSIPVLSTPKETVINTFTPELIVIPSVDIDRDKFSYEYKVYDTEMKLINYGIDKGSSYTINSSLADNSKYYWQAQAKDEHNKESGWTEKTWFVVNHGNDIPSSPIPVSPINNSVVNTETPELIVKNAKDFDGDTLTYHFQVFDNSKLKGSPIAEVLRYTAGYDSTILWKLDKKLENNKQYWWRTQAHDGKSDGRWSQTFSFTIRIDENIKTKGPCIITNILLKISQQKIISNLNKFRDEYLLKSTISNWLVDLYY